MSSFLGYRSKPSANTMKEVQTTCRMPASNTTIAEPTIIPPRTNLMDLPTELHLQISKYLTYPDALSLKHTNRHFYSFVYTGVNLKVEWLIKRRNLHLDCPHDKGCELGSDTRFCRGSVRLLMKRRREHGECETREGGRGCLVFETKVCTYRKERMSRMDVFKDQFRGWMREYPALVWFFAAFLGITLACSAIWLRNSLASE